MSGRIRPARPGDEIAIARVHIASWQSSYKGIVPDEILGNLPNTLERRVQHWQNVIAGDSGEFVFVAEMAGEIVGFASGGAERSGETEYDGELYAIYLLETYKRRGLGEKLFEAVTEKLKADGYATMMLCVFRQNPVARGFYEKMGGRVIGEKKEMMGAFEADEVVYGWEIGREN